MNNSKNEDISKEKMDNNIESTMNENNEGNISIHIMHYNLLSSQQFEKKESLLIKVLKEDNSNNILNYLRIKELILFSVTCKFIKSLIEKYYLSRLQKEYDNIKIYEEKNIALKSKYLEKSYPYMLLSQNNWFHYDINKSIETISKLSRNTISQIRGIKKLPNLNEKIYAPFCIIFNFDTKNERVMNNGWKKTADYIMSDPRFFIQTSNLIIENLEFKNINNAFTHLNTIENYIEKVKRFSPYLYELNLWCKSIIIYYFLVHPYTLNDSTKNELSKDKDIYKYVTFMDNIINKFYLFKGFLENKKLLKPKLGEYIFKFDYDIKSIENYYHMKNKEKKLFKLIEGKYKIMGNILSYLNINESIKFISFNKSCFYCFEQGLNISCYTILKKIFIMKYNTFNDLYSLIPTIFENNIFSKYFFMLEDIIYPENSNIFFLTKDDINYIKNYKGDNKLIDKICKIFCILFNIKSEKIYNDDYAFVNLYIKSVILFCVKENSLTKLIKYFNIFNLNNNQIKSFYEELTKIYIIDDIKKVKNINKGFYQLFIWELYIFEYIKQLNPFLLMDKDTILNRSPNALNEKQINIINNYMFCLEKLKMILKIKYHFKNLFFSKNHSKSFINIIKDLIEKMKMKKIYNDSINYIVENYNINQSNISTAFFKCKKIVMNKNKNNLTLLYQKIMEQIILNNLEMVKGTEQKDKTEKIIKNENFYINCFTSRKNLKYYNLLPKKIEKEEVKYPERKKKTNNNNNDKFINSKINKNSNLRYDFDINKNYLRNKLAFSYDELPSEKLNRRINLISPEKLKLSFRQTNNIHLNLAKINDIQDDLFITKILFYLSINDFSKVSLVNKKFSKLIKTHIYIRLFFLEKKKIFIEKKNSRIIYSIDKKRYKYYLEHKISPPNLQNSCILLSSLSKNDIFKLRNLFKNYKLQYEVIISVLCIFLGIQPNIYHDETGQKIIDFFSPGKRLLYNKDVINIIKKLDLDNINYKIYTQVEKIMQSDCFSINNIVDYYPCLINLIKFEFGVIEYYKSIRKYSLSIYDYQIFNDEEIEFCKKINESLDVYYKIKNYTFNKCQLYHSNAIKLLKRIDLDQNLGGEINDFIINFFINKN